MPSTSHWTLPAGMAISGEVITPQALGWEGHISYAAGSMTVMTPRTKPGQHLLCMSHLRTACKPAFNVIPLPQRAPCYTRTSMQTAFRFELAVQQCLGTSVRTPSSRKADPVDGFLHGACSVIAHSAPNTCCSPGPERSYPSMLLPPSTATPFHANPSLTGVTNCCSNMSQQG